MLFNLGRSGNMACDFSCGPGDFNMLVISTVREMVQGEGFSYGEGGRIKDKMRSTECYSGSTGLEHRTGASHAGFCAHFAAHTLTHFFKRSLGFGRNF